MYLICICSAATACPATSSSNDAAMTIDTDQASEDDQDQEAIAANSAKKPRITAAEKLLSSLQSSSATTCKPMDEVILYMQEQTPNINTNPLEWWKLNG